MSFIGTYTELSYSEQNIKNAIINCHLIDAFFSHSQCEQRHCLKAADKMREKLVQIVSSNHYPIRSIMQSFITFIQRCVRFLFILLPFDYRIV